MTPQERRAYWLTFPWVDAADEFALARCEGTAITTEKRCKSVAKYTYEWKDGSFGEYCTLHVPWMTHEVERDRAKRWIAGHLRKETK